MDSMTYLDFAENDYKYFMHSYESGYVANNMAANAQNTAEKYLKQGSKIVVTGHIQTGSYTNREGQKVYTTDVVVEEHEFAESKKAAGETADSPGTSETLSYLCVPCHTAEHPES